MLRTITIDIPRELEKLAAQLSGHEGDYFTRRAEIGALLTLQKKYITMTNDERKRITKKLNEYHGRTDYHPNPEAIELYSMVEKVLNEAPELVEWVKNQ